MLINSCFNSVCAINDDPEARMLRPAITNARRAIYEISSPEIFEKSLREFNKTFSVQGSQLRASGCLPHSNRRSRRPARARYRP